MRNVLLEIAIQEMPFVKIFSKKTLARKIQGMSLSLK